MMLFLKKNIPHSFVFFFIFCMFLFLFLPSFSNTFMLEAHSGEREKALTWAGLDLFPSMLAADINIAEKRNPEGMLLLVLLYDNNKNAAEDMARYLRQIKQIRNLPVRIELKRNNLLLANTGPPPAGIFITERIENNILREVIQFGIEHHIIVFSPFEGDVSQGVLGGIMVREKILPCINMETLRSSDIKIKPFFLRIAKKL